MIRVAFLGAGKIIDAHIKGMLANDRFAACAIADLNTARAREAAAAHGLDIPVYSDYSVLLEQERPDAAVIALPHFLHKDAALRAIAQSCHIMIEKPMALNTQECADILTAAKQQGVQVFVGHTQHFFPGVIKMKELIEAGEIGELVMINDYRYGHYFTQGRAAWCYDKAMAGGGVVTMQAAHSIDKIQYVSGSRVDRLRASLSFHGPKPDLEGSGMIFMELENGVPATITCNGYKGINKIEIECFGTKGMLRNHQREGLFLTRDGSYEPIELDKSRGPFERQYAQFMADIESGVSGHCSGEYGAGIVSVLEAIYDSAAKRAEVRVARL